MAERRTKDKVLVVDDEKMIRYTLIEALRSWGYGVSEAGTVAAGLAVFDAEQPAIVLLDINLPGRSGLESRRFSQYSRHCV